MSVIRRSNWGEDGFGDRDRWNNNSSFQSQNHHFPGSLSHHHTHTAPPQQVPHRPAGPFSVEKTSHSTTETIEWKETPTMHVFKVDMHGVRKEEVKLEVENGRILKIISEKVIEKEDRGDEWLSVERSRGTFIRSLMLPADAKPYQAEACMENGLLVIKVPKEMRSSYPETARIPLF